MISGPDISPTKPRMDSQGQTNFSHARRLVWKNLAPEVSNFGALCVQPWTHAQGRFAIEHVRSVTDATKYSISCSSGEVPLELLLVCCCLHGFFLLFSPLPDCSSVPLLGSESFPNTCTKSERVCVCVWAFGSHLPEKAHFPPCCPLTGWLVYVQMRFIILLQSFKYIERCKRDKVPPISSPE